jgi:hypothetical protein
MDTDVSSAFHIHNVSGTSYTVFGEHVSGLYLNNATTGPTTVDNSTNPSVIDYSYLHTITDNKVGYTKHQIKTANNARQLYHMMGRPITIDDAIRN